MSADVSTAVLSPGNPPGVPSRERVRALASDIARRSGAAAPGRLAERRASPTRRWWPRLAAASVLVAILVGSVSSPSVSWLLARSSDRAFEYRVAGMPYRSAQTRGAAGSTAVGFRLAQLLVAVRDASGVGGAGWVGVRGRLALLDSPGAAQVDASIESLNAANSAAAGQVEVMNDLAVALLARSDLDASSRAEDVARAVELLMAAAAIRPNSVSYFNLALAYTKQLAYDVAVEAWDRFLELEPQGPWADEARARRQAIEDLRAGRAAVRTRAEDLIPVLARQGFGAAQSLQPSLVARQLADLHQDPWLEELLLEAQRSRGSEAMEALRAAAVSLNEGRNADGEILSRRALEIFTRSGNEPGKAYSLFNLAFALQRVGEPDECLALLDDGILQSVAAKQYRWLEVQLRLTLATCLGSVMQYGPAYDAAAQARALAAASSYYSLEIRALGMMSGALREVGSYREALPLDESSLVTYWAGGGGAPSNAYQAYYGYAVALAGLGHHAAASSVMRDALRVAEQLPNRTQEALARSRFAEMLADAGKIDEASVELRRVEDFFASEPASEDLARAYAQLPRARLDGQRGEVELGLRAVEEMQRAMMSRRNSAVETQLLHVKAELLARNGQLDESDRSLRELLEIGDDARRSAPVAAEHTALARRVREAADVLVARYLEQGRAADAWSTWTRHSAAFLSVRPNDRAARVIYLSLPSGSFALVSDASGVHSVRLGSSDGFRASVDELRALAADAGAPIAQVRAAAEQVSRSVVAPLLPYLQKADVLYVAADGAFAHIPYGALTLEDGRWLSERFRVVYSPPLGSARTGIESALSADARLLSVTYGAASEAQGTLLSPLDPEIERESIAAAAAFPVNEVVVGDDATTANVITRLARAEIFHFSGHAILAANDAALVMKPETTGADALLWVSRLPSDALRNLRLVVLAACSTGRAADAGRYPGSDMARAFLLGGVPSVVASAWEVDTRATTRLIEAFYDALRKGRDSEAAMADAVTRVRGTEGFAHPYYWAAFALYRR
jgi:CHAT domain-containing protein